MSRILIVAYGNPLRSDDGVGWRAADTLSQKLSTPNVEILRLHQLAPELADTLRGFDRVIFIDAACNENDGIEPGNICIEEIATGIPDATAFTHGFSPQTVLELAADLYGIRLPAFSVTIQGSNFDHGNVLSETVADALPHLISTVERLVSEPSSKA